MIVDVDTIKELKNSPNSPNSAYQLLKFEFTYHSNKIEGSSFTKEELELLMSEKIVSGLHKIDDINETMNLLKLFDYMIDTLNEPLSGELILKFHKVLKDHTIDCERGWAGCWKKYPNMIFGAPVEFSDPSYVELEKNALIKKWNLSSKTTEDVLDFHVKFETIHPVQDGNGRLGRLILLKQCIENRLDLLMLGENFSVEYKKAIGRAQTKNECLDLLNVFDKNLSFFKESIGYIMYLR